MNHCAHCGDDTMNSKKKKPVCKRCERQLYPQKYLKLPSPGTLLFIILTIMILAMVSKPLITYAKDSICLNSCYQDNITCDPDDNNCVGGDHYCYDYCVGGTTYKPWSDWG